MAEAVNGAQNPAEAQGGTPANTGVQNEAAKPDSQGNSAVNRGTGGDGATGGEKKTAFSYNEDRSDWIPRHRLNEVTAKEQAAAKRIKELEDGLSERERRIRALAGVETPDAAEAESAEIRAAIVKMFPILAKLSDEEAAEKLDELFQSQQSLAATTRHYWGQQAERMLDKVGEEVSKAIGVDTLSKRQKATLAREYRDTAAACAAARRDDPNHDFSTDFLTRHEKGDPTLVTEIAKGFLDDWFEPARRTVTASAVGRFGRPVPDGNGRGVVKTTEPKKDLSNEDNFREALEKSIQRHTGRG